MAKLEDKKAAYIKSKKKKKKIKTSTEVSGKHLFIRGSERSRYRSASRKAVKKFKGIKGVTSYDPEVGSYKTPDDGSKPKHLESMVKKAVRTAEHKSKYGDIKKVKVKKKKKY
jgi:hypothetical protein